MGFGNRWGIWGWVVLALVVAGAVVQVPPIWDAVTHDPVDTARVSQPFWFLLGAPLFGVWDGLSLLATSQHFVVLGAILFVYVVRRIRAPKRRGPLLRRAWLETVRSVLSLAGLFLFYAGGLLLPRPMVGIEVLDQGLVAVDFHSHTNHSHDGWSAFTPDRNRAWHEAGGFHAAYVTDHAGWTGVDEALPANPATAGEGLLLLSGAEIRLRGRPTNLLGDRTRYTFALDSSWIHIYGDSLRAAHARGGPDPTLIYTMPGPLDRVVPFGLNDPSGVIGIELNDGAPRGLEDVKSKRTELLALADEMDLAVVAGSNLHGWGRTVSAWSLLRIPGWRSLNADELGDAIETELHDKRRDASQVVERRMPYLQGNVGLVLTPPLLVWEFFRMLTFPERISWVVWTVAAMALVARRRQHLEAEV